MYYILEMKNGDQCLGHMEHKNNKKEECFQMNILYFIIIWSFSVDKCMDARLIITL